MSENRIGLKTVSELLGMKFFIPNYQRGYRWTEQQVKDLLNDVDEFCPQKDKDTNEETWYCLQPLVVKKMEMSDSRLANESDKERWYEVIDGQQRLTTIFLIVHYFNEMWVGKQKKPLPTIHYETRSDSFDFLNAIEIELNGNKAVAISQNGKTFGNYIDYHYMKQAYSEIHKWAVEKGNLFDNNSFQSKLIAKTRFIWYESVDEDPVRVFRRLNNGKIKLTDAELVKALMLNRSNFGEETDEHLKLRQQEIASEWDSIEYALQNDEFWLFLRNIVENDKYKHSTRIDFIFDLICEQQSLGSSDSIGNDEHKTFRYFYEFFHTESQNGAEKIKHCWTEVKKYFQTFQEWYIDLELYHYVGYLIHQGEKLDELYKLWNNVSSKENFVSKLKEAIKEKTKKCNDLAKQYEIDGPSKTTCSPLLLLHNIQTIINQNNQLKSKEEYKLAVFYKFPFHIFKKENWDVEHIDSNTTNGLEKTKDQKEWLKYSVLGADLDNELKEKIKSFIQDKDSEVSFNELAEEIEDQTPSTWENPELDKNKVWNFVLLDAGTNRGYGNSIFPAKRRCIIGKDQGKSYTIDDDLNVSMEDGAIAFIPPVTRNVFLKYYNTSVDNLREWNEKDATAYKQNILDTLKEFGVKDSSISAKSEELLSNNENTENYEQ